jgi:hypothetical protein
MLDAIGGSGMLDSKQARSLARAGGVLYLLIIAIGALGEVVVRGRIVVSDPAATVASLRSMQFLWRLGIAGEVVLLIFAVALTAIFYVLLRVVSRDLALLAVFFNLVSIAIEGSAAVSLTAALFPLSASYAKAFGPEQIGVLTMLAIRAHTAGFGIALIFFGVECVILGHLIRRSGFMPRWIGVSMQIAGACYLVNSFALLLSPPLANRLFPLILVPSFIAELSLALWLVVKSVNAEKWDQRVSAATQPATALVDVQA